VNYLLANFSAHFSANLSNIYDISCLDIAAVSDSSFSFCLWSSSLSSISISYHGLYGSTRCCNRQWPKSRGCPNFHIS